MTSNNSGQVFKSLEQYIQAAAATLPHRIGLEVVRYSYDRFREQAWDGVPWQRRKPGSKNNTGRAILVKSGRLRRSIRITTETSTSVTVGSDVPYAKVHNEGFNGPQLVRAGNRLMKLKRKTTLTTDDGIEEKVTVRYKANVKVKAFTRRMRMPRRQFLGDSPYLRRNLERIVIAEFKNFSKS